VSRIEHLLAIEGLPSARFEGPSTGPGQAAAKVPPSLLEEVFALNEELDEIREQREAGADAEQLLARLAKAREPIEAKRDEHERQLQQLSARWDSQLAASDAAGQHAPAERRATLEALRERLLERNYINNLLGAIEREGSAMSLSHE
jgi:hypothetical protein